MQEAPELQKFPANPVEQSFPAMSFHQPFAGLSSDFDLQTIKFNNNGGANYIIPVGNPSINWANLQWPGTKTIEPGQPFNVFGQVWIDGLTGGLSQAPGLQAWVGYSTENTNPDTWTNWIPAAIRRSCRKQ